MDMPKTLPPDQASEARKAINLWTGMYDRDIGADIYSPNYPRWLGSLCGGLMQAKPPTVDGLNDATGLVTNLPELIEETVTPAAGGAGVTFLRPVHNGDAWTLGPVSADRVRARWQHRRLVEAMIWTISRDPSPAAGEADKVALVEVWTMEEGLWTVGYHWAVGTASRDHAGIDVARWFELSEVPDKYRDSPLISGALENLDSVQGSELSAFVWDWYRQHPAPVYASNEQLVKGLERLWDQEQVDAEMIKNRIVLPETAIGTAPVFNTDTGGVLFNPGWQMDSNVFLLKGRAGSAQGVQDDLPFHVVQFTDSLTQRDRIERRENALLEACGINPQSVGRSVGGRSDSAAAKRADQQMTLNTVSNPADRLQRALSRALTVVNGLNGSPAEVDVTITPGPKPVASESAETARILASAGAASTRTLIATAHPEWSDMQIDEEVARMAAENQAVLPMEGIGLEVPDFVDGSSIKDQADAMGVLIRAGVDPEDAARLVGLRDVEFTGAIPTSLRVPRQDASALES